MILHIINGYHNEKIELINELLIDPNNILLFINDAAFYFQHAIKKPFSAQIFALRDSVLAFGMEQKLPAKVKLIDYQQWVELTVQNPKIITL